jgi:light-regulated signal transduction histidine kinase (bacteriophytochrome)
LAVLIESFNEMLQEIQQRDSQLQKAHGELEQRVAERTRELVLANRELEAFSYSVSHDLLGPLDALNGFSYLLSKQYGASLEESGKQLIEHIRASGKRMVELIDDLLNLSRITTSVMQAGKVDLSEVARSVIGELRQIQPHRSVEIGIFPTPEAQGDARLLRIVIENLLRNSWKYTSTHSAAKIEFASQLKDGQVVYFVRDDGVGFDPRSVGRLFQPFQRLHSSAEFTGNGIGLATVQRIVRRHGGDIWAEGAIEKGSTFYFTLPSSEARSAVAAPNFGKPDGKSAARRVEGS